MAGKKTKTVATIEEAIEQGFGSDSRKAVPGFTLWADRPGHLRALLEAAKVLPAGELSETLIRDFELYEEANR